MGLKQLHKDLRKAFNEACLERDDYQCVFCGWSDDLAVHHIINRHDMPNGGYAPSNGITVCEKHHWKCEECLPDYTEKDCFDLIGTTFDQAYEDCEKLCS